MNVFEFAMQMEKDGEQFYRELAGKTKNAGLKKIFSTLADEEVVHYDTFKKLGQMSATGIVESNVLEKAKNIFLEMKVAGGFDIAAEMPQTEAYKAAMEAEKKAYAFYEEKAGETTAANEKEILLAFAREERRHYRLLEYVLEFVTRPESWLEDAEFVSLVEY